MPSPLPLPRGEVDGCGGGGDATVQSDTKSERTRAEDARETRGASPNRLPSSVSVKLRDCTAPCCNLEDIWMRVAIFGCIGGKEERSSSFLTEPGMRDAILRKRARQRTQYRRIRVSIGWN